jgi:hypothetical protein
MHYRQTIIDAVVAALDAEPDLFGHVSSSHFFPEQVTSADPYVRVLATQEQADEERRVMDSGVNPRVLQLQVNLLLGGHDVQRSGNDFLETIERVVPATLTKALVDCAWYERIDWAIAAEQDRETYTAESNWSVWYATELADPSTRA